MITTIKTLITKLIPGDNCHGQSTTNPQDGRPPSKGWSPNRKNCTTTMCFGTYTKLIKLITGGICHGWSPIIRMMVPHQPKDSYLPKEKLQTRNLAIIPNPPPKAILKENKNCLEMAKKSKF